LLAMMQRRNVYPLGADDGLFHSWRCHVNRYFPFLLNSMREKSRCTLLFDERCISVTSLWWCRLARCYGIGVSGERRVWYCSCSARGTIAGATYV
jgi:hypothetical protein